MLLPQFVVVFVCQLNRPRALSVSPSLPLRVSRNSLHASLVFVEAPLADTEWCPGCRQLQLRTALWSGWWVLRAAASDTFEERRSAPRANFEKRRKRAVGSGRSTNANLATRHYYAVAEPRSLTGSLTHQEKSSAVTLEAAWSEIKMWSGDRGDGRSNVSHRKGEEGRSSWSQQQQQQQHLRGECGQVACVGPLTK